MADNSNQIIAATVKVDTAQGNAAVKEFNSNVKDAKTSLSGIGEVAGKASKDIDGAGGSFKNLKGQLGALPGAAGQAQQAVSGLSGAFKALLANPIALVIVAIVGALTLLYKAFTNTFEGAQKVEQIFAGVKAAAQALFDDLSKIGSAIVKFFSFDFSGAAAEIKGIVDDVGKAYTAMSNLTAQAQKLHQEQLQNDLEAAQRQKQLAILREQATDETVPLAKRKAALQELKKDAEQNAKDDIDLAKRTTENKIAQLTLEKDGARKNQDEINKLKIEQINVETDNANELRRIGKQLTAAEKQEQQERIEAAKKSAEERKKIAADLAEYQKQLLKLQQENELLSIKDSSEKELKQLQIKIADQKKSFDEQLKARKINQTQYDALIAELNENSNLQENILIDKYNKEKEDKEAKFQTDINALKSKILLGGIDDARQLENTKLDIDRQERLNKAAIDYKNDAVKLQQVKDLIDEDIRQQKAKQDEKNLKQDQENAFNNSSKNNLDAANDPAKAFSDRKAALDAEDQLLKDSFANKLITETQYNEGVEQLGAARKKIKQEEIDLAFKGADVVRGLFDAVADAAGRQTAVGKALAVASATIATIESAVKSFNAFAEIPIVGPALGAVAAGAALVSGYSNVKKILAVQVPGGHGGGGSVPSVSIPQAPVAPTAGSTKLDAKSINDVGNAAAGGVNRNFRAYVVEQDNAAAANRAARLQGQSVLGGG